MKSSLYFFFACLFILQHLSSQQASSSTLTVVNNKDKQLIIEDLKTNMIISPEVSPKIVFPGRFDCTIQVYETAVIRVEGEQVDTLSRLVSRDSTANKPTC